MTVMTQSGFSFIKLSAAACARGSRAEEPAAVTSPLTAAAEDAAAAVLDAVSAAAPVEAVCAAASVDAVCAAASVDAAAGAVLAAV